MSKVLNCIVVIAIVIVVGVLSRFAWIVFGRLDTIYSPGYSEAGFNRIFVGMRCSDVEALLGAPLSKLAEPSREIWYFSKQANPRANYYNRVIFFDRDCKVSEVFKELYVD